MSEVVIQAEDLVKQFGEKSAVDGVSFSVRRGEIFCLLGPNGAGKTTTIKMLLGLITPTSGRPAVMGYDMADPKQERHGRRHVGAVLEGSRNIYHRLSALENLRYWGRIALLKRDEVDERARQLLERLELLDVMDKEVRFFSRGMQQKVAVATAFMKDPEVLLLDEPTLGLDVAAAQSLEETIARAAEAGKAIVLTTHNLPLAERLAHRIFVIHEGREVAHGEKRALLKRFDTRRVVEIRTGRSLNGLRDRLAEPFPSLVIQEEGDRGLIEWVEPTQPQIIQLYQILNDAGIEVISVMQREPALQEVFLSLTRKS